MRITLDVQLSEAELSRAGQIQQALEGLNSKVEARIVTDKGALASRIAEAIASQQYDQVTHELVDCLSSSSLADDCVEVLCSAALFNVTRYEKGVPVEPFVAVLTQLPENQKVRIKKDVVQRAVDCLSAPRRLDCSRAPLLPYAETLAALTKADLLSVRNVVCMAVQMIQMETTRTAGMTCLGKLVETCYASLRQCDSQLLDALRAAVASAQRDDTFLYDVEYIMEAFGWSQNKSMLRVVRSGAHHNTPILSLACCGGPSWRDAVVTSSIDGTIGTWDRNGTLMENIILSRHYATALDLTNQGHALIVGSVGRSGNTPPAVILYVEESLARETRWLEFTAVEPKDATCITALRAIRRSVGTSRYCVAVTTSAPSDTSGSNSLLMYDCIQLLREYRDHSDVITALHIPDDQETMVISGSRDRSVMIYDLRARLARSCLSNHSGTVSSIVTRGDLLFTGGLDKQLVVEDMRMLGHPISRDMDSAVLSLDVNSSLHCAVSTLTGIYFINFKNGAQVPTSSMADSGQNAPRYNAIGWSADGSLLYAGGESKDLDVFCRSRPDKDYDL